MSEQRSGDSPDADSREAVQAFIHDALPAAARLLEGLENAVTGSPCDVVLVAVMALEASVKLQMSEADLVTWTANRERVQAAVDESVAGALRTLGRHGDA